MVHRRNSRVVEQHIDLAPIRCDIAYHVDHCLFIGNVKFEMSVILEILAHRATTATGDSVALFEIVVDEETSDSLTGTRNDHDLGHANLRGAQR